MLDSLFQLSSSVSDALHHKQPIVALESTVISHGLPYPDNIETVHAMEAAIDSLGATPATIGLIAGKIKIGLTSDEIQQFSNQSDNVLKVNRADLAYCLSKKSLGATTVSATAFCAAKAGLPIFATGGIGGVHRGAEDSFDISCDLTELSKTQIMVVCSGAKSILDIPKTLEYLETQGVPIIGYKTNTFPLFYSAKSQYGLNQQVNSVHEAAQLAKLHFSLQQGGLIMAHPIPEEAALPSEVIEQYIIEATASCQEAGIRGKNVTPYVLRKLTDMTEGQTLSANKALLIHNAKLAAEIACAYQKA